MSEKLLTIQLWHKELDSKDQDQPSASSLIMYHKKNPFGTNIGIHWYLTRAEYANLKVQYSKRELKKYGVGRRRAIS